MSRLIRDHDWAATPLGPIEHWPPSRRTAVEILLAHGFAMVALWGEQLIQIYNDAYAAILGARHPAGLGQPNRACWPEVWHVNEPIYERVQAGETVTFEDKHFRVTRNGPPEDAWFTLAYSPLRDETGAVAGVLVTVVETTEKVLAKAARRESERQLGEMARLAGLSADFRVLFEAAPAPLLVLAAPALDIIAVNDAYLRATMTERAALLGRHVFDAFPPDPDDPDGSGAANLGASLRRVLTTRCTDTMAVQRYPIRRPAAMGGGFEERWWSPVNSPVLGPDGEVALIIHRVEDVTRQRRAETARRESDERFRLIVESARDYAIFTADAQDVIDTWLPGAAAIFGWSAEEAVGQPAAILFTPEDRANREPEREVETARRLGVAPNVRWHIRKDGTRVFIEGSVTAQRDANGQVRGFLKIGQDVTGRKAAEDRQSLLAREVDHRAKNALAVVQAAVRLTPKHDAQAYARALEGRVHAIARAQTLLAQQRWNGARLDALLRGELEPFLVGERADLRGPPVLVPAETAQPLGMAIHELATNALKHGALSVPEGRVRVRWGVAGQPPSLLRLRWEEQGGPPVAGPPARRGFGSRVLEGTVRGQLGGEVALEWQPGGLLCRLDLPLGRAAQGGRDARPGSAAAD
jgi:PAS domain S-box-containing protein